jgi:hypothetical protein
VRDDEERETCNETKKERRLCYWEVPIAAVSELDSL